MLAGGAEGPDVNLYILDDRPFRGLVYRIIIYHALINFVWAAG